MKGFKLVRLIASLEKRGLKGLEKYISSFHSENIKTFRLLLFIKDKAPKFDFSMKEAHEQILPEKEYGNGTYIRKVFSTLQSEIKEFLTIENCLEDSFSQEFNLLRYYNDNNMVPDFEIQLKKILKNQNKIITRGYKYYFNEFKIQEQIIRLQSSRMDINKGDVNFNTYGETLDRYYLLHKARILFLKLNSKQLADEVYDQSDTDREWEIIQLLFKNHQNQIPIASWVDAIQLLRAKNENKKKWYLKVKTSLDEKSNLFDIWDLPGLCTSLHNNAVYVFEGKEYYKELFTLYDFQIKKKVFEKNTFLLTPTVIVNITIVGIKLKKIEWVESFINDFLPNRIPTDREEMRLCKSLLDFEKKNFQNIIHRFENLKLKNLALQLTELRLVLKADFEINKTNNVQLESHMNRFHVFLSRNKDKFDKEGRHIFGNRQFLSFLNRIYNFQDNPNLKKITLEHLNQELSNWAENALPEKEWLIEKTKEIKVKN